MSDPGNDPPWAKRAKERTTAFKENAQSTTQRWSEQEKQKLIEVNRDIRKNRPQPMLTPNGQLRQRADRMVQREQDRQRDMERVRKKLEKEHRNKVSSKDIFNERSRG